MCQLCQSRRDFLKLATLAAMGGAAAPLRADLPAMPPRKPPPAGVTAWARLITEYPQWMRHWEEDAELTKVLVGNGVKISTSLYSVEADTVDALLTYPLLFTLDLSVVRKAHHLDNLREYLYRGGFLYIDGCNGQDVRPSWKTFHDTHLEVIARLLPEAQIRILPSDHPIFRVMFPVDESVFVHRTDYSLPKWRGARCALWGVYDDDRMVMLLSQEHLRCAWGWKGAPTPQLIGQAANIHAYALLQSPLLKRTRKT